MDRRELLKYAGAGAISIATGTGQVLGLNRSAKVSDGTDLRIQKASYLLRDRPTDNLISLSPDNPPPVLTARQGEPVVLNVINDLDEYTTIHWHGIRLSNNMDGVPYLTQLPIAPGESFRYRFISPDAGTFWYHPHCATMTQMAYGLTGALVVQEAVDPGFDGDQVINLKDFRLDAEDRLMQPYTLRGAARAGTLGNVMTANWLQSPVYDYPTGGLVRLRLINSDTTRIYELFVDSSATRIIAQDGHPVEQPLPNPDQQRPLELGPGQRADIAVVMPDAEGKRINIIARNAGTTQPMASLRAKGTNLKRSLRDMTPLPPNPVSEPDYSSARRHQLVFGWSPDGLVPNNGLCGNTLGKTFWSINKKPWPGDIVSSLQPLATLKRGKSYILRLINESPNLHPIHLHGLAFKPIGSNQRTLASNWTDTVLLLKNEIIDIALVADNPGNWALHCHVIEHQKTGLTGFIQVV